MNDALVAKKLVEVAFVVVAFVATRSVKSPEMAVRNRWFLLLVRAFSRWV